MRFAAILASLAFVAAASAQPDSPTVKKLAISPAAAPRPALKYVLLPEGKDRTPGNAALGYFRTFAARPAAPSRDAVKAADVQFDKWHETPVADLPVADVRKALDEYNAMFRELDKAVVCDRCDWEMGPRIKADGIGVLLNEVQPSREVMRYLALRTRMELAENRFDDAARDLRSGLQLAQHVGEGPTMIQLLVGLALESIVLERVEEWISRPGSPNLYWALSSLPDPLIDPKPAMEGEVLFLESFFPSIRKLERERLTPDQAAKLVEELFQRASGAARDPDKPNPELEQTLRKLGVAGYVAVHTQSAKTELIARGRPAKSVEAMTPSQAVFLNSLERFDELRDDQWKWFGQPYHLARPALQANEERRKQLVKDNPTDPIFALLALLLPTVDKTLNATARTERKLAALRTLEAIRLHLAASGKLPAKLSDITAVPVPTDPVTGNQFVYTASVEAFTLVLPAPAGETTNKGNSVRFEVTLRAK